jgi:hypothetical protein
MLLACSYTAATHPMHSHHAWTRTRRRCRHSLTPVHPTRSHHHAHALTRTPALALTPTHHCTPAYHRHHPALMLSPHHHPLRACTPLHEAAPCHSLARHTLAYVPGMCSAIPGCSGVEYQSKWGREPTWRSGAMGWWWIVLSEQKISKKRDALTARVRLPWQRVVTRGKIKSDPHSHL